MSSRKLAAVLAVTMSLGPLAGCGKATPPPPVDDSRPGQGYANNGPSGAATTKPGVTTTQKVVLLAGAAALYYLYKHHQSAAAQAGLDGQYYLSKNGRVYYRDAEHRAHWVTAPADGVRVPEDEARQYSELQGYENRSTGRDLSELPEARNANQ